MKDSRKPFYDLKNSKSSFREMHEELFHLDLRAAALYGCPEPIPSTKQRVGTLCACPPPCKGGSRPPRIGPRVSRSAPCVLSTQALARNVYSTAEPLSSVLPYFSMNGTYRLVIEMSVYCLPRPGIHSEHFERNAACRTLVGLPYAGNAPQFVESLRQFLLHSTRVPREWKGATSEGGSERGHAEA